MMKTRRSIVAAVASVALVIGAAVAAPSASAQAPFPYNTSPRQNVLTTIYSDPAPDAEEYLSTLQGLEGALNSKYIYHVADIEEARRYRNNRVPQHLEDRKNRSDYAVMGATARYVIALLQTEGNADARAIDATAVGVEKQATIDAYAVMWPALFDAFILSEERRPDAPQKSKRYFLFNEAYFHLKRSVEALNNGDESVLEHDAYAVVDWGSNPKWVAQTKRKLKLPADFDNVQVLKAQDLQVSREQAVENGAANRAYMEGNSALTVKIY